MNKEQGTGIAERVAYGAVLFLCMKLVSAGYIDAEMAAYIASGAVAAAGSAWAWWRNRPISLLQSAASVVGTDGQKTVVIASPELANSTSETNIVAGDTNEMVRK